MLADVTSCEPDFLVAVDAGSATPNDADYATKQFNMPDIGMPTAWKTGQFGSQSVRTCVIDTGVDFTHPDLVANLWMNPAEVNGPGATAANGYQNGIDDDGNGAQLHHSTCYVLSLQYYQEPAPPRPPPGPSSPLHSV